jgi:hypothetical protein
MCEGVYTLSISAETWNALSFTSTPPTRFCDNMHEHRGRVTFPLSLFMSVVELEDRVEL